MRTVFECAECGYLYKSPWYEPRLLARRFWEPDHAALHDQSEWPPIVRAAYQRGREDAARAIEDWRTSQHAALMEAIDGPLVAAIARGDGEQE